MNIHTMTINMALAAYTHPSPDDQIKLMATRYLKRTTSQMAKKPLRTIINCKKPTELIRNVYKDQFE